MILTPSRGRRQAVIVSACVSVVAVDAAVSGGSTDRPLLLEFLAVCMAVALVVLYRQTCQCLRSRRLSREGDLRTKVSCELMAPLTRLASHLELLRDGTAGPLSDDQQAIAEVAIEGTERVTRMVENLLDLATVDPAMIIGYCARP